MKSVSTFNNIIPDKRGISEHNASTPVNSGRRKSSFMGQNHSNGKIGQKHIQKQSDLNVQLQKVSSAGSFKGLKDFQNPKPKRFSSREGDSQHTMKQGYLYKQISPKVIKSDDQISVVFTKEINQFHMTNEPTSPKSPKMIDTNLFMHELASNGVLMKGPQSPPPHDIFSNGTLKNKIPKSVLSHHQNLIPTPVNKKLNESKAQKTSQNTITYF